MPLTAFTTCLRARRVPQRVLALVISGAVCALVARVPVPSLSVDLGADPTAAGYPAVLVAAAAPVLLGVLVAAPAPTRLRWLTDAPAVRARLLALIEFVIVLSAALLAAVGVGVPADQVGVAVQNAAITGCAALATAVVLGQGPATALVGAGATMVLLASPTLPPAPWVLVDVVADPADWVAAGVLGTIALTAALTGPSCRDR